MPPMWNSFSTDTDLSITAAIIEIPGGGGDTIHAYLARPAGPGPHPAVLALHHMPGWDEFYQELCERLARHGYAVLCPDLYCRFGHGTPDDVTALVRAEGGVTDESVVGDSAAALDWLKSQPWCSGRVAVMGTCSGGRHAVLAASLVPGFSAVVDLWGGNVVMAEDQLTAARPVAPIDYTDRLDVPVLGLFGNDDRSPSPAQVDQHEAALQEHGRDYEFHRYDGAGHGFFYYHGPMYRPEQAMSGWERVFDFLQRKLRES